MASARDPQRPLGGFKRWSKRRLFALIGGPRPAPLPESFSPASAGSALMAMAKAASASTPRALRSMLFGEYWLSRPFVFSFVPREPNAASVCLSRPPSSECCEDQLHSPSTRRSPSEGDAANRASGPRWGRSATPTSHEEPATDPYNTSPRSSRGSRPMARATAMNSRMSSLRSPPSYLATYD